MENFISCAVVLPQVLTVYYLRIYLDNFESKAKQLHELICCFIANFEHV